MDPTHKIKIKMLMCLRDVVFYMGNEYRSRPTVLGVYVGWWKVTTEKAMECLGPKL